MCHRQLRLMEGWVLSLHVRSSGSLVLCYPLTCPRSSLLLSPSSVPSAACIIPHEDRDCFIWLEKFTQWKNWGARGLKQLPAQSADSAGSLWSLRLLQLIHEAIKVTNSVFVLTRFLSCCLPRCQEVSTGAEAKVGLRGIQVWGRAHLCSVY